MASTFDPYVWSTRETVWTAELNHMEQGIHTAQETANKAEAATELWAAFNMLAMKTQAAIRSLDSRAADLENGTVSKVTILKLPGALREIDEEAYQGNPSTVIVCPASLTTIRARAFSYCVNLRLISIPNTVTSIASDAFLGCISLTVLCPAGSYADSYARGKGYSVVNF